MKKMALLIAKQCFGSCEGCYFDQRCGEEISAEEVIRFAGILKEKGYKEITISGGDPLTRKDIFEIVAAICGMGFAVHLDTMGRPFLKEEFLRRFPLDEAAGMIALIGLPFDGSTDEIFRRFRTHAHEIKETTLKILSLLDAHSFRISINTVVHRGNIGDLQNIYDIITRFPSVIRWELHQFAPISNRGKELREKYEVSDQEFGEAVQNLRNDKNILIDPKRNTRKLDFEYLDFNGDIVRLNGGERTVLGNIRRQPADAVLARLG